MIVIRNLDGTTGNFTQHQFTCNAHTNLDDFFSILTLTLDN